MSELVTCMSIYQILSRYFLKKVHLPLSGRKGGSPKIKCEYQPNCFFFPTEHTHIYQHLLKYIGALLLARKNSFTKSISKLGACAHFVALLHDLCQHFCAYGQSFSTFLLHVRWFIVNDSFPSKMIHILCHQARSYLHRNFHVMCQIVHWSPEHTLPSNIPLIRLQSLNLGIKIAFVWLLLYSGGGSCIL